MAVSRPRRVGVREPTAMLALKLSVKAHVYAHVESKGVRGGTGPGVSLGGMCRGPSCGALQTNVRLRAGVTMVRQ